MIKLGICTRYYHHEAAYVALRIARWIEQRGGEVSIFSASPNSEPIDSHFDAGVTGPPRTLFTEWALTRRNTPRFDAILWTMTPPRAQAAWAKERKIRVMAVPLWCEFQRSDATILAAMDAVLHPLRCAANHAASVGLRNGTYVPWDTGEPIVRPLFDNGPLRFLFPLFDGLPSRMTGEAITAFLLALSRLDGVRGTVLFSPSTIASPAKRLLSQYARRFPDKLLLRRSVAPEYRHLVFQRHALAFWPTHAESTCMVGLSLAAAGVPIVTNLFPPTQECFDETSGVLVPSWIGKDPGGITLVGRADYRRLSEACCALLTTRSHLWALRQHAGSLLEQRRADFDQAMTAAFGEAL
jgi:hypothetical protein